MGLWSATALNMIDMIGVGPFITMPLVVSAMGGPQALLGWIAGALLAVCDGLVSAELGAALPESGRSTRVTRCRVPFRGPDLRTCIGRRDIPMPCADRPVPTKTGNTGPRRTTSNE